MDLPRPPSLPSLPTKADFNPDQVFTLPIRQLGPPLLRWVRNWEEGRRRLHPLPPARPYYKVPPPNPSARFYHCALPNPPNTITGSHHPSLPWHMSVFDAELCAASCTLQYAASLSPPPGSLLVNCKSNRTTDSPNPRLGANIYCYHRYLATILTTNHTMPCSTPWIPSHYRSIALYP